MTDRTYLKIMVSLGEDLERICSAEEFDQAAYDKVLESVNRTNRVWYRSRHRRTWLYIAIIVFYLCVSAWLFYEFLCYYEF